MIFLVQCCLLFAVELWVVGPGSLGPPVSILSTWVLSFPSMPVRSLNAGVSTFDLLFPGFLVLEFLSVDILNH